MIRPIPTSAAAAITLLGLVSGPAAGGSANLPIVDKAIAFHGGERYERSRIAFTIASDSGAFDVEIRRRSGLYEHAVTTRTESGAVRTVIVTNDDVAELVDGEPQPVAAEREARLRRYVSARVYFPMLPYRLADPAVRQADLGPEEWPTGSGDETRTLHKVGVTFESADPGAHQDEFLFWFDPTSGRLEQYAYSFDGGLRFRRAFDFERVGGILFADHRNLGIDWAPDETPLPVDVVDPDFVTDRMELVSTIRVEDVVVEPID